MTLEPARSVSREQGLGLTQSQSIQEDERLYALNQLAFRQGEQVGLRKNFSLLYGVSILSWGFCPPGGLTTGDPESYPGSLAW